jgi:uncharacterized protein YaiI (UPF0178 family)
MTADLSRRSRPADIAALPSGERVRRPLLSHLQALVNALPSPVDSLLAEVTWLRSLGGGFEVSDPVVLRPQGPVENAAEELAEGIAGWFQTARPEAKASLRFHLVTWPGDSPSDSPSDAFASLRSVDIDPPLDAIEVTAASPAGAEITIWVDADAMPRALREVLFRAAERRQVPVILIANIRLDVPAGGLIRSIQVAQGPDVADDAIAEAARPGDLVITQDIPLAARLVPNGVSVVQPSGRELDQESIDEALALRDLKESLREAGEATGGPPPFNPKQKQRFSNALDRWITHHVPS